jgi:hypothetical protein
MMGHSNLPPGVTNGMIERQFGEDVCEICFKSTDDCVCPACTVCGEHGNPKCYTDDLMDPKRHSQKLTKEQLVARYDAFLARLAQSKREHRDLLHTLLKIEKPFEEAPDGSTPVFSNELDAAPDPTKIPVIW